jgi:hypothetical protein
MDEFHELRRDHEELLMILADEDELSGRAPRVHRDTRCRKGRVPHIITIECDPLPSYPPVSPSDRSK